MARGLGLLLAQLVADRLSHILCHKRVLGLDIRESVRHLGLAREKNY